jgi:hypothetical protein
MPGFLLGLLSREGWLEEGSFESYRVVKGHWAPGPAPAFTTLARTEPSMVATEGGPGCFDFHWLL